MEEKAESFCLHVEGAGGSASAPVYLFILSGVDGLFIGGERIALLICCFFFMSCYL